MEPGGEDDEPEDDQHVDRVVEHVAHRARDPVHEEEPEVERAEPGQHGEDHGRQEERPEDRRDRVDDALRDERRTELEREQRIRLAELLLGAVRGRDDPERAQLLVDQELRVLGADPALEGLRRALGDLGVVAAAVDLLGEHVQERGQLDHLSVGAASKVGRVLVARPLHPADQIDAVGQARRLSSRLATFAPGGGRR